MGYERIKSSQFFEKINSEESARSWIWHSRFNSKEFVCPGCKSEKFWQHKVRPELRQCSSCKKEVRLRVGTIFENSKTPLLIWLKAIHYVMQGKRGVSALELKRLLNMNSYGITWAMLHKIREALRQRDESYKIKDIIELDGAVFGNQSTDNQAEVLIAIESKDFVDENGRPKSKAGFAKVVVAAENKEQAQAFVDAVVLPNSFVNTDGGPALIELEGVNHDYQVMNNQKTKLDHWLPWVHKFISNAKTWILGTHHGIEIKYLRSYLAEYTYRFNRRHDQDSLFHRAVVACILAKPKTAQVLFG